MTRSNDPLPGARPIAIVGAAALLDGYDLPQPDHTLVARWGKVVAFGPRREVAVPDDAVVIDGHGCVMVSEAPIQPGAKASVALFNVAVDARGERGLVGVLDGRHWLTEARMGADWSHDLSEESSAAPAPAPVSDGEAPPAPETTTEHRADAPELTARAWRMLAGEGLELTSEVIRVAPALDGPRAIARLLPLDPCDCDWFGELVDRRVPVPREVVSSWIDRLVAEMRTDQRDQAAVRLGQALVLLGRHRQSADAARLEAFALSSDQSVQLNAGLGFLALHGLEDLYSRLCAKLSAGGLRDLAAHEQMFLAVHFLDGAIGNGGWPQFFDHYPGVYFPAALAGLLAIGARGYAELLRETGALFGPEGPDRDDEDGMSLQLDTYDDEEVDWFALLEEFDARLPSDENLTAMLYVWAGRNAALFGGAMTPEASS